MQPQANEFAKALCEVLGISTSLVRGMTLSMRVGEPVIVNVELVPKVVGVEWREALSKLVEDEKIVNLNWNRPVLDVTNLESKAKEFEA